MGTRGADNIVGPPGGGGVIASLEGDVVLEGGPGSRFSVDIVYDDEGNDTVDVRDATPACGRTRFAAAPV